MTPREVIPAEISEEVEAEVSTALHKMVADERRYAGSPWRPIETAPKDGTLFLAYMRAGDMEIARYDLERNEWWIDAYAPPHIEKHWMKAWMLLPAPPKMENEK